MNGNKRDMLSLNRNRKGLAVSVQNVWGAILMGFLAILGIRLTYPFVSSILDLWTETNIMKVAAIICMWLIYYFVLYWGVWMQLFSNPHGDDKP